MKFLFPHIPPGEVGSLWPAFSKNPDNQFSQNPPLSQMLPLCTSPSTDPALLLDYKSPRALAVLEIEIEPNSTLRSFSSIVIIPV